MRNPQKEVEQLLQNPVQTKQGIISVIQASRRQFICLDLDSFPGRPGGSVFMFSPEEWVRVVAIMEEYFAREKKKPEEVKQANEPRAQKGGVTKRYPRIIGPGGKGLPEDAYERRIK